MASEKNVTQKEQSVDELSAEIKDAKIVILTDYRGINVDAVTALRKKLSDTNSKYRVIKNNIIKRAVNKNGVSELDEFLVGPTAIAVNNEDYSAIAKILVETAKQDEDVFSIKAGIIDGKVVGAEEIKAIASLPAREVLIAQVLGGLNTPITGLANVLNANISGLARALSQIAAQKSA